jgi:hypothetical protein
MGGNQVIGLSSSATAEGAGKAMAAWWTLSPETSI